MCTKMRLYFLFGYMSYDKQLIYIYIYIEQLVLLQNRRLIIEDVALSESQQNLLLIDYQRIKYNKECNC